MCTSNLYSYLCCFTTASIKQISQFCGSRFDINFLSKLNAGLINTRLLFRVSNKIWSITFCLQHRLHWIRFYLLTGWNNLKPFCNIAYLHYNYIYIQNLSLIRLVQFSQHAASVRLRAFDFFCIIYHQNDDNV